MTKWKKSKKKHKSLQISKDASPEIVEKLLKNKQENYFPFYCIGLVFLVLIFPLSIFPSETMIFKILGIAEYKGYLAGGFLVGTIIMFVLEYRQRIIKQM